MKTPTRNRAVGLISAVVTLLAAQMPKALSNDATNRQRHDLPKAVYGKLSFVVMTGNQNNVKIHLGDFNEAHRQPTIDSLVAALSDREFGRHPSVLEATMERNGGLIRVRDEAAMICARLLWISDPKIVIDVPDSIAAREDKIVRLIQRANAK